MQPAVRLCLFAFLFGVCRAQLNIVVQIAGKPGVTQTSVVVGGRVRVECFVENLQGGEVLQFISWTHDDVNVVEDGDHISIEENEDTVHSLLEIDDAVIGDAGVYECAVRFTQPEILVLDGFVTIAVETVLIVEADPEQEAVEGETAVLLCNASSSDPPTITWFRIEDGTMTEIIEQDFGDPWFGNLTIPNVNRDEAGTYLCEGSNQGGTEEVEIKLVILTIPEIVSDPEINKQVQKQHIILLPCKAEGVRPPTYTWFFKGEELVEDNRTKINTTSGELKIDKAVFADTGLYTCYAENSVGNDSQNNTILIVGAPEILLPVQPTINDTEEQSVGIEMTAVLSCPFIGEPDGIAVWKFMKNGQTTYQTLADSRITNFHENGTLLIEEVEFDDTGTYLCNVSNEFGSDVRRVSLTVIEAPLTPDNFKLDSEGPSRSVELSWDQPTAPSSNREVVDFVVEVKINDEDTWEILMTFPDTATNGMLNLMPGLTYSIRLLARNLGGSSAPSSVVTHETQGAAAELKFFETEAEDGGRSVLLTWELEFTGGPAIEDLLFTVMVLQDGTEIAKLTIDVSLGEFLVTGLDPETSYQFSANVLNEHGDTDYSSDAITSVAPPSKPTRPDIDDRTTRAITLAFSVDFGSAPITQFLLDTMEGGAISEPRNLSDTNFTRITYLSIDSHDLELKERVNGSDHVIGYDVELEVSGLEKDTDYVFAVAAENEIGVGEFSDNSDSVSLEDETVVYYIVGGVVGGVLLVLVVIVVVVIAVYIIKKRKKRTGKMLITHRGADGFHPAENMNFDPHTTSAENIVELVPGDKGMSSPYYNTINKHHNGTHYNVDDEETPMVDEPDAHLKFNTLPVHNPSYSDHTSSIVDPSVPSPAHMYQPPQQQNGGTHAPSASMDNQYLDSFVSENLKFPETSTGLDETQPGLSHSTPMLNRNSYDMDGTPKNASYMTDV